MTTKRRHDSFAQTSLDRRYLATICAYMIEIGKEPETLSALVRFALQHYVDILVDNSKVQFVEYTRDATSLLDHVIGEQRLTPGGKWNRAYRMNLVRDGATDVEALTPRTTAERAQIVDQVKSAAERAVEMQKRDEELFGKMREVTDADIED